MLKEKIEIEKHLKTKLLISLFLLTFSLIDAQSIEEIKASDTLYFKFKHLKNQERLFQKTISNENVGEYYYNYITKDKFNFIMFSFNYRNHPKVSIVSKSVLKKRKPIYIDYQFLKSKPMMELNAIFNNKVIILIDSKEINGRDVKLKEVVYQTSMPFDM